MFAGHGLRHLSTASFPRPDYTSFLQLIQTLCASKRSEEAHHRLLLLLSTSSSSSSSLDQQTYNTLISSLLKGDTPLLTLRLLLRLSHVIPLSTVFLSNYNRLTHLLSSHSLLHAHRLLFHMHLVGPSPSKATYTTILSGYAQIGEFHAARQLFDEMFEYHVVPNSLTYSMLIKAALRKRAHLSEAGELMRNFWQEVRIEKEEGKEAKYVRNGAFANIIQCLCHDGLFHEVFHMAEKMPQGNSIGEEFSYSHMIDSLCRYGQYHGASRIMHIMKKRGLIPSMVSCNCIIHGLSLNKGCMRAYQLFKEGVSFGYTPYEPTYKALVESLCRENDLAKAKDVLNLMLDKEFNMDSKKRLYNIFLGALRVVQNPSEQLDVLLLMLQKQCQPNVVTLNTIIHGFCKVGKITEAKKIMHDMINGTLPSCLPDVVTFTILISGLFDTGQSDEALDMLYNMVPKYNCVPNIVTYNATLKGLFGLGKTDDALKVFDEMIRIRVSCDTLTYTAIIEGLFQANRVEEARRFWDDVIWPSKIHDDHLYAALFSGLCKSDNFEQACHFLYELVDSRVKLGVVNYNILIDCACKKGLKREAYHLLSEMRKNGLKPDPVTWRILDGLHHRENLEISTDSEENLCFKPLKCRENLEIVTNSEQNLCYKPLKCGENSEIVTDSEENLCYMPLKCGENSEIVMDLEENLCYKPLKCEENSKIVTNSEENLCYKPLKCRENSEIVTDLEENLCYKPSKCEVNPIEDKICAYSKGPEEREPLSRMARRVFGLL
ncbi:hypothetical protein LUZ60_008148 [Juncus effusus]|nr:hypothetical protein LUZ60_008148 [Juncus effusus]